MKQHYYTIKADFVLVSLVSDLKVVGSGSIRGRTHTEGFEIIEENLLTLLWHLQMVELFVFSNKDENLWETSHNTLLIWLHWVVKELLGAGGGGILQGTYESRSFLMSRSNPFPVKLEMASFKLSLGERISTVG